MAGRASLVRQNEMTGTAARAWAKLLAAGPPEARASIGQTLSHRQQDTDLAGLRDAAALARRPAADRTACEALWTEVAALLMKTGGRPTNQGVAFCGNRESVPETLTRHVQPLASVRECLNSSTYAAGCVLPLPLCAPSDIPIRPRGL